jgi:hypothetical protein
MNIKENIYESPINNDKYRKSLKHFQLKEKILTISQLSKKIKKDNFLLKDSFFKEENKKNIENLDNIDFLKYNNHNNASHKNIHYSHNRIDIQNDIKKLTKRKLNLLSSPLLIQKRKIHKKDVALAERLFLSSRLALSNNLSNIDNFNSSISNNNINSHSISNNNNSNINNNIILNNHKTYNLFKLTKNKSCSKLNNVFNFSTEKIIKKRNYDDYYSNNNEKNEFEFENFTFQIHGKNKLNIENKKFINKNQINDKNLFTKISKKIRIDSLNSSTKNFSTNSLDKIYKIKKKDIINPEEQHFLCVNFQKQLKAINSLIN